MGKLPRSEADGSPKGWGRKCHGSDGFASLKYGLFRAFAQAQDFSQDLNGQLPDGRHELHDSLADAYISRGPTFVMPHGRKLDSEFRAIQAAITETDSLSNHSTAKHHVIELDDTKQKNVYITYVHVIAMR